jgi:Flp pilus assembly protein TadD
MTVVNHEPSNVDALVDLGGALIETGRAAEAAAYFQRAIDRGAEGTLAWNGLAFAKRQAGDRSGAIEALRHSLAIQPNQPRIAAALDEMLRQ